VHAVADASTGMGRQHGQELLNERAEDSPSRLGDESDRVRAAWLGSGLARSLVRVVRVRVRVRVRIRVRNRVWARVRVRVRVRL